MEFQGLLGTNRHTEPLEMQCETGLCIGLALGCQESGFTSIHWMTFDKNDRG